MNIDVALLAQWAGALMAIFAVIKFVVEPFQSSIKRNEEAMKSLQKTIDALSYDLRDSQKDRANLNKITDLHTVQIGQLQDDTIINKERISTLFEKIRDK